MFDLARAHELSLHFGCFGAFGGDRLLRSGGVHGTRRVCSGDHGKISVKSAHYRAKFSFLAGFSAPTPLPNRHCIWPFSVASVACSAFWLQARGADFPAQRSVKSRTFTRFSSLRALRLCAILGQRGNGLRLRRAKKSVANSIGKAWSITTDFADITDGEGAQLPKLQGRRSTETVEEPNFVKLPRGQCMERTPPAKKLVNCAHEHDAPSVSSPLAPRSGERDGERGTYVRGFVGRGTFTRQFMDSLDLQNQTPLGTMNPKLMERGSISRRELSCLPSWLT